MEVLPVEIVIEGVTTGVTLNPILFEVTTEEVTQDKFDVNTTHTLSLTLQLEALYDGLFVPTATLFFIH